MTQKQRIAMQRALVREALGKLNAAAELFGAEEHPAGPDLGYSAFDAKVREFEEWAFSESGIA